MDNALALPVSPSLDIKTLLARVNHRLALLRTWLSHAHTDEPYWWARRITVSGAQSERRHLRFIATLLHVERATKRGRIHGTYFETIDKQRAWLHSCEAEWYPAAAQYAGLPANATLVQLRQGKLPL